jgi:hypothetical protein
MNLDTIKLVKRTLGHDADHKGSAGDGEEFEADGKNWLIFEDERDAYNYAVEVTKDMLEDDPKAFTELLLEHATLPEWRRNDFAGDDADSETENMSDDKAIENAGMTEKKIEMEAAIEDADALLADLYDTDDPLQDTVDELKEKIKEAQKELERLSARARDKLYVIERDRVYDELSDPVKYLGNRWYDNEALLAILDINWEDAATAMVDDSDVSRILDRTETEIVDEHTGTIFVAYVRK